MNIAKIDNGNITVGDYRELFPSTSFPVTGPNDDFFTENNCLKVSIFKEYDKATQMLVGCDPYEENGMVYMVTVQAKPQEETIIIDSGNGADSI
jgi:CMP-N-acetylneuraminic acid synthetase